jgi:predicted RNA-binding Zn ribbon-like protein
MAKAAVNEGKRVPRFIAGALCLDFVNTVAWRGDPDRREDRIGCYADLVSWAETAQLISVAMARMLIACAEEAPRLARAALRSAGALREELYALTLVSAAETASAPGELAGLLARLGAIAVLDIRGERPNWVPTGRAPDLRLPLIPVAVNAASLLIQDSRDRVRSCADHQCGWVFLDETRTRSRLWCSMEDCGNRAKAREHYRRKVKRDA